MIMLLFFNNFLVLLKKYFSLIF